MPSRPDAGNLVLTVKITLDRAVAGRARFGHLDDDAAFFVLGLLKAHLADAFGPDRCVVELETATGQQPEFLRSMNAFARRYYAAMAELNQHGEVEVADPHLADVFRDVHRLRVVDLGDRWSVARRGRRRAMAH